MQARKLIATMVMLYAGGALLSAASRAAEPPPADEAGRQAGRQPTGG